MVIIIECSTAYLDLLKRLLSESTHSLTASGTQLRLVCHGPRCDGGAQHVEDDSERRAPPGRFIRLVGRGAANLEEVPHRGMWELVQFAE